MPFPKTRRVVFQGNQPASLPGWVLLEVALGRIALVRAQDCQNEKPFELTNLRVTIERSREGL